MQGDFEHSLQRSTRKGTLSPLSQTTFSLDDLGKKCLPRSNLRNDFRIISNLGSEKVLGVPLVTWPREGDRSVKVPREESPRICTTVQPDVSFRLTDSSTFHWFAPLVSRVTGRQWEGGRKEKLPQRYYGYPTVAYVQVPLSRSGSVRHRTSLRRGSINATRRSQRKMAVGGTST